MVQSTAEYAQQVISAVSSAPESQGLSFQQIKEKVNAITHDELLSAFIAFMSSQCDVAARSSSTDGVGNTAAVLAVEAKELLLAAEYSQGHRWSAAFPLLQPTYEPHGSVSEDAAAASRKQLLEAGGGFCYINTEAQFIACGDYFDAATAGRVEGAALSGLHAAEALIALCSNP